MLTLSIFLYVGKVSRFMDSEHWRQWVKYLLRLTVSYVLATYLYNLFSKLIILDCANISGTFSLSVIIHGDLSLFLRWVCLETWWCWGWSLYLPNCPRAPEWVWHSSSYHLSKEESAVTFGTSPFIYWM